MPHAAHRKRHDHTEQWLFEGRGSHLYDRLSGLLGRRLHRRVAADVSAGAPAGGAVLDVGAGTGRMLVEIGSRRSDLKLFGIDLSPDMVALAQRHLSDAGIAGRASTQAGDVAELPYPDDSFDGVRELGRVLRPGGKLWIYDFRFVSDREFTVAARAEPAFGGQPVLRTLLRPGLLPIYVRLTQSRPPTAP
jgi:ubiquinone/menaquinone biosynthesis C-methylase UbiE